MRSVWTGHWDDEKAESVLKYIDVDVPVDISIKEEIYNDLGKLIEKLKINKMATERILTIIGSLMIEIKKMNGG